MLFLPRNMKYDLDIFQWNIIEINEKYYVIYLHFTWHTYEEKHIWYYHS
jgi:hypothetical protein